MKISKAFFFFPLLAMTVLALGTTASGQLLVENFSYTAGDTLHSVGGWAAHSGAGTNPPLVTSGGLTYTGYASSGVGNAVSITTNGEDVNKSFASFPNGTTSGSLYYSLMVRLDSVAAAGDYFFHLIKNSSTFSARVFARRAANGNIRFGIGRSSTAANINYSDSIYTVGTTYLLVVKYTVIAGTTNDTVALWINPPTSGSEPAPAVLQSTADRGTADIDTVYGVAIRQGTAANASIGRVDGIRVDTAWPLAGLVRFENRPNLFLTDATPAGVTDTLTVSGIPAGNVVTRLTVVVDTLTHTWVGDIIMRLTHGSTTRTLMNRPGSGVVGSSGDNFIGTTLVDSATLRIDSIVATGPPPNGPPYTGFFRPDSGGAPAIVPSSLSPFNGSNPNGQWILFVSDNELADTGRVRQWSLIIEYGPSTSVEELPNVLPNGFALSQNYPNPFNPTTTIRFSLPEAANVNLSVYNLLGQRVTTLDNDVHSAGVYNASWNGRNDAGAQVASGIYFYRIEAKPVNGGATFISLKKAMLLK